MSRRAVAILVSCALLLVAWLTMGTRDPRAVRPRAALQRDEAHREPPADADRVSVDKAGIAGRVVGPGGPLSGVCLAAEPMHEGMVRGSGGSGSDGYFRLEVDAPGDYRVVITPDSATGLSEETRLVSNLQPGEERVLDIDLSPTPVTSGRVIPPVRVDLSAIPAADFDTAAATAATPYRKLVGLRRGDTTSGGQGKFEFRSLAPGEYCLVVATAERMLREVVRFRAGESDIRAEVVGVFGPTFLANDVESGPSVGDFLLEVRDDAGEVLGELRYRGGKPERPLLFSPEKRLSRARLRATGYEDKVLAESTLRATPVWIRKPRPPNLRLRVGYEDGVDVRGDLAYLIAREPSHWEGAIGPLEDGTRSASVPVGTWRLVVGRGNSIQTYVALEGVVIRDGHITELDVTFERGGRLRIEGMGEGVQEMALSRIRQEIALVLSWPDGPTWFRRLPPLPDVLEDLLPGPYGCMLRYVDRATGTFRTTRLEFAITGTETVALNFRR